MLVSAIAEGEGIPKKFPELIPLSLKSNGIVDSKPGAGAGIIWRRIRNW